MKNKNYSMKRIRSLVFFLIASVLILAASGVIYWQINSGYLSSSADYPWLNKKTVKVSGAVFDQEGNSVSSPSVRFIATEDSRYEKNAWVDKTGSFYVYVHAPWTYNIEVKAEGYFGENKRNNFIAARPSQQSIEGIRLQKLEYTSIIEGSVYDQNGNWLQGIKVGISGPTVSDIELTTDSYGYFNSFDYQEKNRGYLLGGYYLKSGKYVVTTYCNLGPDPSKPGGGGENPTQTVVLNKNETKNLTLTCQR